MREPVSISAVAMIVQRAAVLDLARGGEHLARNFPARARPRRRSSCSPEPPWHAVVGAGDARERIHQNENILAGFHDAAAKRARSRSGKGGRAFPTPCRFEDATTSAFTERWKSVHFLGPLINQQHHRNELPGWFVVMALPDLLEDGGFARARRGDDDAARAFADGRDEVNHARLDQVRRRFQIKFFNRVNRGQVLKAHRLGGIPGNGMSLTLVHRFELRAGAAMRRLRGALDEAAFAQKTAADGVGRDKDVRRLGMKMILRWCGRKPETLFGDFEIAGSRNWD